MTSFSDQSLDPETRLVLEAIRVKNAQAESGLDPEHVNLSAAFGLARLHGILPLFFQFINMHRKEIPEETELDSHKIACIANAGRNMRVTRELLHLLDLLAEKGIQTIPFKGPVIAARAFDDIGLRTFCDLDLLIKPEDFYPVYDLMEATEFQPMKPMIGRMKKIWSKTRRSFEFQSENLFVDFHQQVAAGPRFLRLNVEWDRLSSVELNKQKVPCLNREDTILMLAMHGTHHGWSVLKYVADFAHFVAARLDGIDWEGLKKKARRMGTWRMVLIGMSLGRKFCRLQIPSGIEDLLDRDRKGNEMASYFEQEILKRDKPGLIPQMAFPRSLDSRWYRIRYLAWYIFNPTNLDVLSVPLPAAGYPLYFVIRPVRLLLNLVKGRKLS